MGRLKFQETNKQFWNVINNKGDVIGTIFYYKWWNNLVFETAEEFIHSYGCLQEIADFMKKNGGKP